MQKIAKYVGLDVHKDTIAVASSSGGPLESVVVHGSVPNDLPKLLAKLSTLGPLDRLSVVYEAGPTGFGLCRALRDHGVCCIVVAPNRVPQIPGPKLKTDKRDARWLAHQLRMNSLTGIAIPDEELEALRDLVRAREDSVHARRRTRQQLGALLLRHDLRWTGKSSWNQLHITWIASLRLSSEAPELAKKHYLTVIAQLDSRIEELTTDIERIASTLRGIHGELYRMLQALRGVQTLVAATLVSELGDLRRFPSASKLMSYVGMVPSEYSSGPRMKKGSITKAGNPHVRRVLVEACWSGRLRPAHPERLKRRQKGLDQAVIDIAWKAQKRLYTRYRRMRARGKEQDVTIIAMAREMLGFMWAIGQRVDAQSA